MPYLETDEAISTSFYNLSKTSKILVTAENGDKLTVKKNVPFVTGQSIGNVIQVNPENIKQTIDGIGTSFTESSAFVLAHLEPIKRKEVMMQIFSEEGANFTLNRTHIGACDFCVEGKYSYDDVINDVDLKNFSIAPDLDGFDQKKHHKIKDKQYDLLPMIIEAQKIKSLQEDKTLKIIASPWTAPVWMKNIDDWYMPGNKTNNWNGTGGELNKEHEKVFSDYIVKYLQEYKAKGVNIWGITPVNEPLGNSGQWESMHFSAESQNDFIKSHLGPALKEYDESIKLLMFDHARDKLEHWADTIYGDPQSSKYVDGAAVHWYESTFKVYEDVFDKVHEKYPEYSIIHTEGCIDDLGKDAPAGALDPVGYKDKDWFDNDSFWWNKNASDWAYSVTWEGVKAEDHPLYVPVHRYARNIIVSLNHWMSGWIDWNIVLDKMGGPNHVGNFCGAPIMIDTDTSYVYYTPIFYILSQLSKTIRPGDRMLETNITLENDVDDSLYSCASINETNLISVQVLNTQKHIQTCALQIGNQFCEITVAANSLQTIQVQI